MVTLIRVLTLGVKAGCSIEGARIRDRLIRCYLQYIIVHSFTARSSKFVWTAQARRISLARRGCFPRLRSRCGGVHIFELEQIAWQAKGNLMLQ